MNGDTEAGAGKRIALLHALSRREIDRTFAGIQVDVRLMHVGRPYSGDQGTEVRLSSKPLQNLAPADLIEGIAQIQFDNDPPRLHLQDQAQPEHEDAEAARYTDGNLLWPKVIGKDWFVLGIQGGGDSATQALTKAEGPDVGGSICGGACGFDWGNLLDTAKEKIEPGGQLGIDELLGKLFK